MEKEDPERLQNLLPLLKKGLKSNSNKKDRRSMSPVFFYEN